MKLFRECSDEWGSDKYNCHQISRDPGIFFSGCEDIWVTGDPMYLWGTSGDFGEIDGGVHVFMVSPDACLYGGTVG
jgi:hypothetical protein